MQAAFDPAFGEAWNRRQVADALLTGRCHYLLIGNDGVAPCEGEAAAGFCLSRFVFDEEELLLFAVSPQHRRAGLGTLLLRQLGIDAAARGAHRLFLEMRHGNPAERLYRNFGFEPVGLRKSYYSTPRGERLDAISFALILK